MFDVMAGQQPPAAVDDVESSQSSQQPTRVRVEFPETWLWSESSAGYRLTPAVIYAATFDTFSWCIGQNCLRFFSCFNSQSISAAPKHH